MADRCAPLRTCACRSPRPVCCGRQQGAQAWRPGLHASRMTLARRAGLRRRRRAWTIRRWSSSRRSMSSAWRTTRMSSKLPELLTQKANCQRASMQLACWLGAGFWYRPARSAWEDGEAAWLALLDEVAAECVWGMRAQGEGSGCALVRGCTGGSSCPRAAGHGMAMLCMSHGESASCRAWQPDFAVKSEMNNGSCRCCVWEHVQHTLHEPGSCGEQHRVCTDRAMGSGKHGN